MVYKVHKMGITCILAYFAVCRLIRNSSKDTLYNQPFIKQWCLSLVDPKNGQPESHPFKSMIKCVTDRVSLRPPDFRLESFAWSQYQKEAYLTLCQIRTCFLSLTFSRAGVWRPGSQSEGGKCICIKNWYYLRVKQKKWGRKASQSSCFVYVLECEDVHVWVCKCTCVRRTTLR